MTADDQVMARLTNAMEVVGFPSSTQSSVTTATLQQSERLPTIDMTEDRSEELPPASKGIFTIPPLITPDPSDTRPFDTLGPPSEPIKFPQPKVSKGRRQDVLCYNHSTGQHEVLSNVLFRDYSVEDPDDGDCRVREAYWPLPFKEPIKTIMGHVEICIVLERCLRSQKDEDLDDESDEASEEDDDIVFQLSANRVAVKVNYYERMMKLKNKHAEDPLKEIAAMQMIGERHPNVLGCKDVLFDGTNLNIVMRFCDSGDLFQLLQESQRDVQAECPGLREGQARYWFRQIMSGIKFLHSIGVCHRDISPENIMIDGTGALIIDMGMCLRMPHLDPSEPGSVTDATRGTRRCLITPQGACGKLPYMSPEIYKNRDCFDGAAADVWTAGTILFCMVTGNRSYQRPHASDPQFYWMSRGLVRLLSDWRVTVSEECVHLLKNMLQVDPRLRLTVDEVLNHPWFCYADERPKSQRSVTI